MKKFCSILALIGMITPSLGAIDQFYKFPEQSYRGTVQYEKSRTLCIFPFRTNTPDKKFEYLDKGLPSVIISELRSLEYTYVEYPKPDVVYHPFGNNPIKTLQEKIDEFEPNVKKRKKDIIDEKDLMDVRSGKKIITPEKDPRYVKLKIKQLLEKTPPRKEDSFFIASQNDCDYVLSGEYQILEPELKVNIHLFDEHDGKYFEAEHKTSLIRAYQEMSPIGESIRQKLQGKETTLIQVETIGTDSALVYLDGVYLGKTPLLNKKFPIGRRSLFVFKEGFFPYKADIYLEKDKLFQTDVKLSPIQNVSYLTVTANEESDVYLGIQYLGKTPLKKVSIPKGMNRLRLSREGYIDQFVDVEGLDGVEISKHIQMFPGNSEIYYKNKQNVFLDHTYKDFATYSLYGSLLFYAGYLYLNYASRQAYEAARPQVELVNASAIARFYETNPNEFLLWYTTQNAIIDAAEEKGRFYKRMAGTLPVEDRRNRQLVAGPMVIGIGLMLVTAVTFYVMGMEDGFFELGQLPTSPGSSFNTQNSIESYSYAKFNMQF
ncbi:PEGA domain-containing protein [Leptospira sp. 96542]|nr:PEGA domain-containing protein [Leptospira sp. 96542]